MHAPHAKPCSAWTKIYARLASALGQRCQLCATVLDHPTPMHLCPDCATHLALHQAGYCPRCGLNAHNAQPPLVCPTCHASPPPWSALVMHGPYTGYRKDLIHRHKFLQDHGISRLLGELLCAAWTARNLPRPDLILPVPLRTRRLLWRGFNQSLELARFLATQLDCPLAGQGLRKVRDTKVQSSLNRAERLRNVRNAFAATKTLHGQYIVLVDDVMTTGATLAACATACRQAGARDIVVAVLARAQ
ncbi:hypothetical protein MASR1M90_02210 [Desulfovibrionales bacterium]